MTLTLIPWKREIALRTTPTALDPFLALEREMSRLLADVSQGFGLEVPRWGSLEGYGFEPRLDVSETDAEVEVTVELPGLGEKDFEVSVEEGVFRLKGEKREERDEEREGMRHRECRFGRFERAIALPCEVDLDKATARFKDGVLSVTLPKPPEAPTKVHRIEIQSS